MDHVSWINMVIFMQRSLPPKIDLNKYTCVSWCCLYGYEMVCSDNMKCVQVCKDSVTQTGPSQMQVSRQESNVMTSLTSRQESNVMTILTSRQESNVMTILTVSRLEKSCCRWRCMYWYLYWGVFALFCW